MDKGDVAALYIAKWEEARMMLELMRDQEVKEGDPALSGIYAVLADHCRNTADLIRRQGEDVIPDGTVERLNALLDAAEPPSKGERKFKVIIGGQSIREDDYNGA